MRAHFECSSTDYEISVWQLTEYLFNNLRQGLPEVKPEQKVIKPKIIPTEGNDWNVISLLKWCLFSDGRLDRPDTIYARIKKQNSLEDVRAALERRSQILLPYEMSQNMRWQITALGSNVVKSVLESPGLLEFFEKELQPVDLCDLLKGK